MITISCEKSVFTIAGRNDEEFPALPKIEKKDALILSQFSLKEIIHQTVFSISDKETLLRKVEELANLLRTKATVKQDIIITGVKVKDGIDSFVYNVALTDEGISYFSSHLFDKSFSGTGDLFSSTMCGIRLNGYPTKEALKIAGNFLYHSISDTMNEIVDGNDGIEFERHLGELFSYTAHS